jgi:SAM-dependent methyltransferase
MHNPPSKEWFSTWFDSPYYHILYKNRDLNEAENFISNLFKHLKPNNSSYIVDVACGKGRHAIQMNKLGFTVDAFDLSENSIKEAKKNENESLHFFVNDIRDSLKKDKYDFAFNLFTSFGYFSDEQDNYKAIKAIADSLTNKGTFVMDFMNANKVINNLVINEEKIIEGITFEITREIKDNFIIKHIKFSDKSVNYHFSERVKAISLSDFKAYFVSAGLNLIATFGNYNLDTFDINSSDRLIMIATK